MIFARVGWMRYYNGAIEERPRGGGSYNKGNVGSELFNFKSVNKHLYGFVNSGSGKNALNLRRIDPNAARKTRTLDDVTVVFVARNPNEGGQYVIGWYKGAVAYSTKQKHPLKDHRKRSVAFCLTAPASECCLLPTSARKTEVPRGRGGIGQSNVRYSYDRQPISKPWMETIAKYIESYSGPNLLIDPDAEAENSDSATIAIETAAGFETNPKIRRAVEQRAMRLAEQRFTKLGFKETKFVEVKGTRTLGSTVALTRNEVDFLGRNAQSAALFIVHSIKLKNSKTPKAYGGETNLIEPWNPSCGVLTPITFFLRLH
jgi:hypothetical protein